jgi:hypothetical protein
MRGASAFLLVVALGACNAAPEAPQPAPTPTPTGSPSKLPVIFEKGWPEFWRDPANAIDTLNRTGARLGTYAAKDGQYQAEAVPTPLDLKPTDRPNTA